MDQIKKAKRFSELHIRGAPLVLYNAWDAGSAKSILEAGALAIATSSWAVAEAQGYRDGANTGDAGLQIALDNAVRRGEGRREHVAGQGYALLPTP